MIKWIVPNKLGTASFESVSKAVDIHILDVRDLVDKAGNSQDIVKRKIDKGLELLQGSKPLVICCDYGMSRSNAVAAGILAAYSDIPLSAAIKRVIEATGEKEIKIDILDTVRSSLKKEKKEINKKRILITGASGFVGQNLIRKIDKKYDYITTSSKEIDLLSGSAELDIVVKDNSVTHIIHMASPRVSLSNKSLGSTLTILRNVLEVCSKNGVTLVIPSSWVVYSGYKTSMLLANEKTAANPLGPYAETKWLADKLINLFRDQYELKAALVRPCSLYGIQSDRPKILWKFIEQALSSLPLSVHTYKNGIPYIDLLHIKDFCGAVLKILEQDFIGDINLGSGRLLSIQEIASLIREKTNSKSEIIHVDITDWTANILMDTTLAQRILNWQPAIHFENGIDEMIEKKRMENDDR